MPRSHDQGHEDLHDVFGEAADEVLPMRCPTEFPGWTEDAMLVGREGLEWPVDCPTVTWWNGMKTILPFVRPTDGFVSSSLLE